MQIQGTNGNDLLVGTDDADTIAARAGVDVIDARAGNDEISITLLPWFELFDRVDGGDGLDHLFVDASGIVARLYWYAIADDGDVLLGAGAADPMVRIDRLLAGAADLHVDPWDLTAGVRMRGVERLSLLASATADVDDLLIVRGDGRYDGGAGDADALYADWSAATAPVVWHNRADATIQVVGGAQISGVERLLVRTGGGDDDLANTVHATDDEFATGAGNDRIDAGAGADRIDAGAGDDEIHLVFAAPGEAADAVDGGDGSDRLVVDARAATAGLDWHGIDEGGSLLGHADARSTLRDVDDMLRFAHGLHVDTADSHWGLRFTGVEHLSLLAAPQAEADDLLLVIGNGRYDAGAGDGDTLYADWRAVDTPIVWLDRPDGAPQWVDGSYVSGVERLLLRTGAADDRIENTRFGTDDEIDTGAGNDHIDVGTGFDIVDAGAGDDTIRLRFADAFEWSDWVHGGAGDDRLSVDASDAAGGLAWFAITDDGRLVDGVGATATLQQVDRMRAAAAGLHIDPWNDQAGVRFDGIEHLDLTASDSAHDLLVVLGNGHYDGGAGAGDTLYADWRAQTADLVWSNLADATAHAVAGARIANVERLLVRTGDGSDRVENAVAVADDEIATGGGDDRVVGGPGDDRIDGGDGIDTARYAGPIGDYTIRIDRAARTAVVGDDHAGRDGEDRLVAVERLDFDGQVFDLFNPPHAQTPAYGQSRSFLFDPAFYLMRNPELVPTLAAEDAAAHYLETGAAEGHAPNAWFDADHYRNRWDDLRALALDDATLFLHYNLYGVWEGRSAAPRFESFDGARYLAQNPDVAAYVDGHLADFLGSRSNGALAHYLIYGADEGRVAFDLAGGAIDATVLI